MMSSGSAPIKRANDALSALLRNGIHWQAGDEILLVQGDFPATIYPWLGLQDCGVRVRLLTPQGFSLSPAELKCQITSSTRLLCVSWINSFDGSVLDLSGIGQLCREHGVIFAVNGSQGVGALPLNVQERGNGCAGVVRLQMALRAIRDGILLDAVGIA